MSDQQLIRGTMILSAGIFMTKMLGLIYIFPFQAIVGLEGLALYTYGYTPYTVLLSLATLGVPLAVSKFVSKYNALGDYRTGQRLLKSGLVVMSATGFFAFMVLFLLAPLIAGHVLDPDSLDGNTVDDAVFTIRMVSVALLVVPVMAIIRGYFQGHQSMGPTALSQVVEQIVRIAFILVLTYLIIEVFNGDLGTAVGFATFGAFVGALGGLAVLLAYWYRRKRALDQQAAESAEDFQIPLPAMYKELFRYAIPISFVGLAIPLYQTVDLLTFNPAMLDIGYTLEQAEKYYAAFTQASHKLIMIPVSVATAMSLTILPTITNAYINEDNERLHRTITQAYQIIFFLSIPAAVGLAVLADPIYTTLFSAEDVDVGGYILTRYAPVAVAFSVFAVTASLLQGINRQMYAVIALSIGVLFKLLTNQLFIGWFDATGAVLSTGGGYVLAIAVNMYAIGKFAAYDYAVIWKRLLLITGFSAVMGATVAYIYAGLTRWLSIYVWTESVMILVITVGSGLVVYVYLSYRSGLAGMVLGERFPGLKKE
ncbi:putative polysaccharide biosynthesis protein [Salisediminibacterium halotolerans]|uniref:putative polysaccharide biosynthesis protein n=1 Tax=Salisediminibacterium halotolerans TaxID=517425 RepID=UPI000EB520A0|nr:polysaccharide biosynthesis protein [Salisediminibacterium halotolerans]RLJ69423.1 O-antigen/teichoic acid export membrane protein [Actinophytocola xinjiangensis]RPE83951.1 O-antigen/teichoic acid export membrane protein [Salisediminibacterium halotolerans]TWG32498.1 O-antigen/teichoic acid export membrane protein [Salisediminibacterium halotolerans]GEL07661.1 cell division protein [Salisediminibacterium halotolerans]